MKLGSEFVGEPLLQSSPGQAARPSAAIARASAVAPESRFIGCLHHLFLFGVLHSMHLAKPGPACRTRPHNAKRVPVRSTRTRYSNHWTKPRRTLLKRCNDAPQSKAQELISPHRS